MLNKKTQKIILAATAFVVVAAAAFYLGGKCKQSKFNKEAEQNVAIHRSDMAAMGKIEEPIYVTGHKSPDSDTVTSAIAYADFLQKLGYDAHAVTLGKINNETAYILKEAGIEPPPVLDNASGKTMVLVDHSEYTQSADGLKDAKVISIIDHHNDGAITTSGQIVYDARPLGATATIVWIRYRDCGIEYDKQIAKVLLGGILSDTKNFRSTGVTDADRIAFETLKKETGI
ncbi:MAG: DHH family phosphoesterase, partial [Treponema sp.]|nr:DHH family phosphoesterase [Treponema sp.]